MIHILLVCNAGMSTSMLVKRMQEAAEKRGMDANIWAVGDTDAINHVEKMDVMLLGPQIRYMEGKMKSISDNKPVAIINMQAYGAMDGDKVLDQALQLVDNIKTL